MGIIFKSRFFSRSTVFAATILAVGSVGWCRHLMSGGEFVALAGTIKAMVTLRAIAQDRAQTAGTGGNGTKG